MHVAADARSEGWAAVYVDFFGVLTFDDVAQRIERAYAAELQGRLASWFAGVRRLLRPTLAAKERADAVIRSEIQHHGDAASYVFAGSHVGMMRELFADRRRAFYGQAGPIDLPPLRPGDVAEHLSARFEATGRGINTALEPLLATAAGHPQRTMLLAHVLWELTPEGETATEESWLSAYDRAMHEVRDELRAVWSALPTSQRRVLVGLAEGREGIYAAGRRHGGSRGGAVLTAIEALVDRGEVAEDASTATGLRVVDPLLAAWVKDGRAGV